MKTKQPEQNTTSIKDIVTDLRNRKKKIKAKTLTLKQLLATKDILQIGLGERFGTRKLQTTLKKQGYEDLKDFHKKGSDNQKVIAVFVEKINIIISRMIKFSKKSDH